jgi:glycosyltransferase involved in cell wall biosynthesis
MKFSIITPVFNGASTIAETIESVLSQEGDFEIEYIIQDGASTDKTVEIARSFEAKLNNGTYPLKCKSVRMQIYSEKDTGVGDAANKGFSHATGDIYAWIGSDDTYKPGAFGAIVNTFETFPEVMWLKGNVSVIDETNQVTPRQCTIYEQVWIRMGVYGRNAYFIAAEGVFWKRELWEKAGNFNEQYKLAIDYDLWVRFAQFTPLWTINANVGQFRKRKGQLSENMIAYHAEQARISQEKGLLNAQIKLYFWIWNKIARTPLAPLYQRLYPFLFRIKTRQYIEIDKDGIPRMHPIRGFIVS